MSDDLAEACWSPQRAGDALFSLAEAAGLRPRAVTPPRADDAAFVDTVVFGAWVEQTAAHLNVEAEPAATTYHDLPAVLRGAGPALVWLPGAGAPRCLALLGDAGRGAVRLLRPDGAVARVRPEAIATALCHALEEKARADAERALDRVDIAPRRKNAVRQALLREWLGAIVIGGVWMLREPPGASTLRLASEAGLPRRLLAVVAAQLAASTLLALGWWTLGRGLLEGELDRGWLFGWALFVFSSVPVSLFGSWSAGAFAVDAGALLKRRLLAGALSLQPDEVRHEGAGSFLGRVIESTAVETLALGAGLSGLSSTISLVLAGALLARGAGGALHALLLGAWVLLSVALVARYYRRRRRWTDARLDLTNDLVERMGGHRTRLAQQPRERWHDGEDQAVSLYLSRSEELDRSHAALSALLPRGWLLVGALGLMPSFVAGSPPAEFAVSLAGVLLAGAAMQGLVTGLAGLAAAAIAWRRVAPLYHAAARPAPPPPPAPSPGKVVPGRTVLEAREIMFRHSARAAPTVRGASLRIAGGDRVLLEGPSGGGKSTLSSLLAGLRAPESGLLLLGGLDRPSLGDAAWRRRVALTPQFHENHVLQNTFAFNLLMGRRWPPSPADLDEARAVCGELGLGDLLARMPGGLHQQVGETGWQLSHGEKSRLYIARSLLQGAEVLLFDESFGALDPETLDIALRSVLARAPTLLVIAHP